MTRRLQTRARGPGSASGAGAPDLRPWWARSAPRPGKTVVTIPPAVERESTSLRTIALAVAPIQRAADERDVFGVLTVSAPNLTGSDRAFAEILGRLAGGALSSQRAREVAGRGAPACAA